MSKITMHFDDMLDLLKKKHEQVSHSCYTDGYNEGDDKTELLEKKIATLFDEIKHGDAEHMKWLDDKIKSHFSTRE